MKKVKMSELEYTIREAYQYVVFGTDIQKCCEDEVNFKLPFRIEINSICITIWDCNPCTSDEERNKKLNDFKNYLDAISFGNLKVIDMGCGCKEDPKYPYSTYVIIANGYELVEDM